MGPSILDVFKEYWPIFLKGTIGTLRYAFIAVAGGSVLGAFVAFAHLSKNKIISAISSAYANILRGTPLLVQMYIAYFFLPLPHPWQLFLLAVPAEAIVFLACNVRKAPKHRKLLKKPGK